MTRTIHLLWIALIVAGCSTSPTPLPTATVTTPPNPTETAVPSPTDLPQRTATALQSDPKVLAMLQGSYTYKIIKKEFRVRLGADGTYDSFTGSGDFVATADQITFVIHDANSACNLQPGVYEWGLTNNVLTLILVKDDCRPRANTFGVYALEKLSEADVPVEFVWQIQGVSATDLFVGPTSIVVDAQGDFYVVDGDHQRIVKFDKDGQFLTMWGSAGTGEGQFLFRTHGQHLGAMALDRDGNIYVTDYNQRVQKFDKDGKFLMQWGSKGQGDGQFIESRGIAVDKAGNVYVADRLAYRIQKFDGQGKFLMKWGSQGTGDGEFGGVGQGKHGPSDMAIDPQGTIFVMDEDNYRIQKFTSTGEFLGKWGSHGSEAGQFLEFGGMTVDRHGNIYVTDNRQNANGTDNRIFKFDPNGTLLSQWGHTGTERGALNLPGGIGVDNEDNIYVVNYFGNVQKFKPK